LQGLFQVSLPGLQLDDALPHSLIGYLLGQHLPNLSQFYLDVIETFHQFVSHRFLPAFLQDLVWLVLINIIALLYRLNVPSMLSQSVPEIVPVILLAEVTAKWTILCGGRNDTERL
jgi:hypothetical protein